MKSGGSSYVVKVSPPPFPSDRWKVSLVDIGLTDQLLAVSDKEMEQKAVDTIVLLLSEGQLWNGHCGQLHVQYIHVYM